jgi:hypothetical protein
VRRLEPISVLSPQGIERHDDATATALECPVMIAEVGKVVEADIAVPGRVTNVISLQRV